MKFKQFLPKSFQIPDTETYDYKGISSDNLRSFLINHPVTDKLFGIECFIEKDVFDCMFISESHRIDLPVKQVPSKLILREYGESNCYFFKANKSSIFPFKMEQNSLGDLSEIKKSINGEEVIILQIICVKKNTSLWRERLEEQYCDYVNGIEYPTNSRIVRSVQYKILELQKKLEGGYRRNIRIDESERKIMREDMFQVEIRYMIFGGTIKSRHMLSEGLHLHFSKLNDINSWNIVEDKDFRGFYKDLQLRRPTYIHRNQILCVSELVNLLLLYNENEIESAPTEITDLVIDDEDSGEEKDKSPFSIFPKGTKKNREDDIHFGNKLNSALRKLSLTVDDVVIQKIQHGATVSRITFNLPAGLKLTDLTKATTNIQTELGLSSITFEQSDFAGCASLILPQEERETIFIRDCVDNLSFLEFTKKAELPLLLGVDTVGEIVCDDLTRIKHLLVVGTTGSGKSVFLNSILCILFALVNPKNLIAYMIDPKMVELKQFKDFPHVHKVYTDMDEAEGLLYYLCEKMDERYSIFEKKNYKNIQQHNRNEKDKLPYIIVVIDELADLIITHPECEDHIVRLAQKARAAGIHLIIATQRPTVNVITGLIKSNVYSRICFTCDSGISYKVALDEVPKMNLMGKGDGLFRFEGIQGLNRFQGAVIAKSEEEQDRIIKKLSSLWKENIKKEDIDIKSSKERKHNDELFKFKKIVLETGETRLNELQKILSIRNERVKDLMNELAKLGWVQQHKSKRKGYELILNEEQRIHEINKLKI